MADVKLTALTTATSVSAGSLVYVAQNGLGQSARVDTLVPSQTITQLPLAGGLLDTDVLVYSQGVGPAVQATVSANLEPYVARKVFAYVAPLLSRTATFTASVSDANYTYLVNAAASVTLVLPAVTLGITMEVIQQGAGPVVFLGSGTSVLNRLAHTQTAGAGAVARIKQITSTQWSLVGDTA